MTTENADMLDHVIRSIMAAHGEQTADLIKAWDELEESDGIIHRLQDISTKDCEQIDALREELDALREELAETKANALDLLEERDALIADTGRDKHLLANIRGLERDLVKEHDITRSLRDEIIELTKSNQSLREEALRLNLALASEQAVTKDLEGVIQDLEEAIAKDK